MESKQQKIVNLTDSARKQLANLIKEEANDPDGVRIGLSAGGCSGLSYILDFGKALENDYVDEYEGIKVLIDPKSALYITGLNLDYQGGLNGRGFVFENPNASKSCGCGTSFSVGDKDIVLEFAGKSAKNVCPSEKG